MQETRLKKELNLIDVFCLAAGAMISSGIFILPGLAFACSGPAVILAYILASILVIPAVLSTAELVTAMPKAGGVYFFIDRSFGPAIGTLGGISSWFSLSFKSAFALTGMSYFSILLFPDISAFHIKLIAVFLCILFTGINLVSVKSAGRLQVFMVLGLLALIVLYILKGLPHIDVHRYSPFIPYGAKSIFLTAGLVFVSFGGLTKVACIAEEIKNPGRNIPLGMFLSFLIVSLLYALTIFVTVGILEPSVLANTKTPISEGAYISMGFFGLVALSFAAILAFISTANAGIMTASRDPMAISRDDLLPGFFSRINKRFRTPHYSIITTGLFMTIVVLFLSLESLVKVASTLKILLFILANLSLISMRESKIANYRPTFKSPLYPWIQIMGIAGCSFLLYHLGIISILTTLLLLAVCFAVYWFYGRKRVDREYALIHLVERIMDRKLARNILESELKDIIYERDEITKDRFDRIIEECHIMDIEKRMVLEEFLMTASERIASDIGEQPEDIYKALLEREKDTSTVLSSFLAIPHIILEGENEFDILVARCKEGILFSNEEKYVKAVFILVGTADERNFHLKALSAIAQIVQNRKFEEQWMKAHNVNNLRDIILLGKRSRLE
ncbi:MAG: amino acid permease [Elusimicrobiota bacterium]